MWNAFRRIRHGIIITDMIPEVSRRDGGRKITYRIFYTISQRGLKWWEKPIWTYIRNQICGTFRNKGGNFQCKHFPEVRGKAATVFLFSGYQQGSSPELVFTGRFFLISRKYSMGKNRMLMKTESLKHPVFLCSDYRISRIFLS